MREISDLHNFAMSILVEDIHPDEFVGYGRGGLPNPLPCATCDTIIDARYNHRQCWECTRNQGRARSQVAKAIKEGRLTPARQHRCTDCGQPAKVYDHRDYGKPLDVEPVCLSCNKRRGPGRPGPDPDPGLCVLCATPLVLRHKTRRRFCWKCARWRENVQACHRCNPDVVAEIHRVFARVWCGPVAPLETHQKRSRERARRRGEAA